MKQAIKPMKQVKKPTTRFYIISNDTGSKFLSWYKKFSKKLGDKHEVYVYDSIDKIRFGNPRDIAKVVIAPGMEITAEQKKFLKKKKVMRIHIDQYYINEQLPKVLTNEL